MPDRPLTTSLASSSHPSPPSPSPSRRITRFIPSLPLIALITFSIAICLLPSSSWAHDPSELARVRARAIAAGAAGGDWSQGLDDGLSVPLSQKRRERQVELDLEVLGGDELSRAEHGQGPTEDDQVRLPSPSPIAQQHLGGTTSTSFRSRVEGFIDSLGTFILSLFGIDVSPSGAGGTEVGQGVGGGGFTAWSEGTVYIEMTDQLHPDRPSSFGPHITEEPLHSILFPIDTFTTSDSYGCSAKPSSLLFSSSSSNSKDGTRTDLPKPPRPWTALVQRGHCPFSQKVRFAMAHGAEAVLFGDQSVEEGGIGLGGGGTGGLLTPWSGDDTSDITIPSAFISRASYLSILSTYESLQPSSQSPLPPPIGLSIILSKEDIFSYPLLDFLLLLLFLPTLLTLLTVVMHRIRMMRQEKLDRAPLEAVKKLNWWVWGEEEEGGVEGAGEGAEAGGVGKGRIEKVTIEEEEEGDEEARIGITPSSPTLQEVEPLQPTESTALLPRPPSSSSQSRPSFFSRIKPRLSSITIPYLLPSPSSQLAPRRHRTRANGNVECAICLCDFEKGEKVMELPCGHLFHKGEIESWLTGSKRLCPVCRASITVEPTSSPSIPSAVLPTTSPAPSEEASATPTLPAIVIAEPFSPFGGNGVARGTSSISPVASSSSVTLESALGREGKLGGGERKSTPSSAP